MHPKVFKMAAKRLRERYTREQVSSTPKQAPAPARANISSISSIESAGEPSFELTSIPSDSSDLALLHAAVDNCETRGVLSNSSDYDLLVTATQTAKLNNYREKGNIINSSTSDSSASSEPAPPSRVGSVVGSKHKIDLSNELEVVNLCIDANNTWNSRN